MQCGAETDANALHRTLGPAQLVILGLGAIIGAGIFVVTGIVAAHHTGPAIIVSFALAAVGCLCAGLCYAEFAAMVPSSGSAFSYAEAAFGRTTGWAIGWCLVLEYLMAGATVAVGWSGYCSSFFDSIGLPLPAVFVSAPFGVSRDGQLVPTGALINGPAVAILAVLTLISLRGIKFSVQATSALVAVKLAVLALFIAIGAFHVDPANWHPFLPANSGQFGEFGWSGVLRGSAIIFFAFLGFDAVATTGREARNPRRTVPIGIIGSLAVALAIYVAFALVLTGLAPYTMLAVPSPTSVALDHAGPGLYFLKVAIEVGAVVGLTSSLMVMLYAFSRLLYAMGQRALIPPVFATVSPRNRAPSASIVACGVIASLTAGLLPIEILSQLISMGTLSAFIFVCGGVLLLRHTKPGLERPFRVPFAPLTCVSGILICGYLMVSLPGTTWLRFGIWLCLGAAVYAIYGQRRSRRTAPATL